MLPGFNWSAHPENLPLGGWGSILTTRRQFHKVYLGILDGRMDWKSGEIARNEIIAVACWKIHQIIDAVPSYKPPFVVVFSICFYYFPMNSLWFYYDFPMVFLSCSVCVSHDFLWFSSDFPGFKAILQLFLGFHVQVLRFCDVWLGWHLHHRVPSFGGSGGTTKNGRYD